MNQKLIVAYEGKDYEASYSYESGFVEVDVSWGDHFHQRKKTTVGGGQPLSIARMMALEILRSAKERGELS